MARLTMAPVATQVLLLFLLGSLVSSSRLVMKSDSEEDTMLYEGPPAPSRKGGKALPSTIIVSSAFGISPMAKLQQQTKAPSEVAKDVLSQDSPVPKNPEDDQGRPSPENDTSDIKFYKIECSSEKPCTSIIPSRVMTPRPEFKPYSLETILNYMERQRLANRGSFLDETSSSGDSGNKYQTNRVDRQTQRGAEETYIGDFRRLEKYIPGFTEAIKGQIYKFQHILSPEVSGDLGKEDVSVSSEERSHEDGGHLPTSGQLARPSVRPWSNARPPASYLNFPTYDNVLGPSSNIRPTRPPLPGANYPRPSGTHLHPGHLDSSFSRPDSQRPQVNQNGKWTRRVTTSVAQLDRNTGEWVKISSNNRNLGEGSTLRPHQSAVPTLTRRTSVGLYVLGANDRQPHSYSPYPVRGTKVVSVPHADPNEPPVLIETDSWSSSSISVPLSILHSSPSTPQQAPTTTSRPFSSTTSPFSSTTSPFSSTSSYFSSTTSPFSSTTSPFSSTHFPFTSTTSYPSHTTHVKIPLIIVPSSIPVRDTHGNSNTTPSSSTTTTTTTTTTTSTTTTRRPTTRRTTTTRPTTTTTTTKPVAFLDNPYAVMATVGAGLIPATFAALLPVFIGGKRRRRRRRRRRSVGGANVQDLDETPEDGDRPDLEALFRRIQTALISQRKLRKRIHR